MNGSRASDCSKAVLRRLLSPALLHSQNLDHADKDVDKVQLETDGFVDGVASHQATLTHAGVLKDLLHVIEGEATEDGKTTVQPDVLAPHESASGCGGQDHGGEAGEGDNGDTGEEGATKVQVFLLLGSGTNKGDAAHQADSVETSAGEDGRGEEHHGREEGGLGKVEGGPEAVLGDVAVAQQQRSAWQGMERERSEKGQETGQQTHFCGGQA